MNRKQKQLKKDLLKWTQGKAPSISFLAIQAIRSCGSFYHFLKCIQSEQVDKLPLGKYNPNRFADYYDDRRALITDMARALECSESDVELILDIENLTRQSEKWWKQELQGLTVKRLRKYVKFWDKTYQTLLDKYLDDLILDRPVIEDARIESLIRSEVGHFFICLLFPCWLLTGNYPQQLFQRIVGTNQPDLNALETIIRIDPAVIFHPKLVEYQVNSSHQLKEQIKLTIATGYAKGKLTIEKDQVKERISQLIYGTTKILGQKQPKHKQIADLFDLLAQLPDPCQEESKPKYYDQQIEYGQAFTKANQRFRDHWNLPPELDKKTLEAVQKLRRLAA